MGPLVGGNLSVLSAMVGTPYGPAVGPNLLFLEEVGEAPYRVDRMLTQLRQAGILGAAAGTMLGVFQRCEATDGEPSLTLQEVLREHFGGAPRPAGYGYSFGHIAQQMTLQLDIYVAPPEQADQAIEQAADSMEAGVEQRTPTDRDEAGRGPVQVLERQRTVALSTPPRRSRPRRERSWIRTHLHARNQPAQIPIAFLCLGQNR